MTGPLLPRNSQAGVGTYTPSTVPPRPQHHERWYDQPGERFREWAVRWPDHPGKREDSYRAREDAEFDASECGGILVHRRIEWGVQFDNGHVMVCMGKADAIERCRSASLYGRGRHRLAWRLVREDAWTAES